MRHRLVVLVSLAGSLLLTAACAYHGDAGNPIARSLSWYSYLNGDDIRQRCAPGSPERYRFVYNGIYTEQVRSYDLTTIGQGGHPALRVHVLGERGQIGDMPFDHPSAVLAPWEGVDATVQLRAVDIENLRNAMLSAGVFQPLTERLELSSDTFYWVVTACTDGAIHFNAYQWPSPRFEQAAFPDLLFAWDPSGIPVNPPRQARPSDIHRAQSPSDLREKVRFNVAASRDGLIGIGRLF